MAGYRVTVLLGGSKMKNSLDGEWSGGWRRGWGGGWGTGGGGGGGGRWVLERQVKVSGLLTGNGNTLGVLWVGVCLL